MLDWVLVHYNCIVRFFSGLYEERMLAEMKRLHTTKEIALGEDFFFIAEGFERS
jgi:hypothetical protein